MSAPIPLDALQSLQEASDFLLDANAALTETLRAWPQDTNVPDRIRAHRITIAKVQTDLWHTFKLFDDQP